MSAQSPLTDTQFDIAFFEAVLEKDPKHLAVIEVLGHLYTQVGRVEDGLRLDKRWVKLAPQDPLAHYNLACSLALSDRKLEAVNALKRAIALGYKDATWMQEDPDLEALQTYKPFQKLLSLL